MALVRPLSAVISILSVTKVDLCLDLDGDCELTLSSLIHSGSTLPCPETGAVGILERGTITSYLSLFLV